MSLKFHAKQLSFRFFNCLDFFKKLYPFYLNYVPKIKLKQLGSRGHFQGAHEVIRGDMEVTPAVGQACVCGPCWPRAFRSNRKQKCLCFGLLRVVVMG